MKQEKEEAVSELLATETKEDEALKSDLKDAMGDLKANQWFGSYASMSSLRFEFKKISGHCKSLNWADG